MSPIMHILFLRPTSYNIRSCHLLFCTKGENQSYQYNNKRQAAQISARKSGY
jgi:hypothetical protein